MVPELAGLSVEEIDDLFKGSWFNAYKRTKRRVIVADEIENVEELSHRESKGALELKHK